MKEKKPAPSRANDLGAKGINPIDATASALALHAIWMVGANIDEMYAKVDAGSYTNVLSWYEHPDGLKLMQEIRLLLRGGGHP